MPRLNNCKKFLYDFDSFAEGRGGEGLHDKQTITTQTQNKRLFLKNNILGIFFFCFCFCMRIETEMNFLYREKKNPTKKKEREKVDRIEKDRKKRKISIDYCCCRTVIIINYRLRILIGGSQP